MNIGTCTACGHNDPHVKNGSCGWDMMQEDEGIPLYFLQCCCDGKSGPRVLTTPTTPEAALVAAVLEANPYGDAGTSVSEAKFLTAAILAALDGWTLVPTSDDLFAASNALFRRKSPRQYEDEIATLRATLDGLRPLAKSGASRAHLNESGVLVRHNGTLWECEAQRCIDARELAWTPAERAETAALAPEAQR